MRFQKFLNEKRKRNVIVVDIQPEYENFISFDISNFTEFLNNQKDILYLYNGPDTIGTSDTKQNIAQWLFEYELNEERVDDITWIDKGFGNFRGWMDQGIGKSTIKQAVRYMLSKGENDSRDIPEEEWIENFPELEEIEFGDLITLPPEIDINFLKQWKGSYIVGGGENECFEEIMILLSAFNIKVTPVQQFIY